MDLIIGMGQVGSTLYTLFISKGIKCAGFDKITTRNRNYPTHETIEVLHIACPYFDGFI